MSFAKKVKQPTADGIYSAKNYENSSAETTNNYFGLSLNVTEFVPRGKIVKTQYDFPELGQLPE